MELDMRNLPRKLEGPEDYDNVCRNFVMPFLHEKAELIADVIERLQKAIDRGDMEQEELDGYVNEIREHSAFAADDSPLAPFFNRVIELEKELEAKGLFKEE